MTELAEPEPVADALPLGPESLVWRYFGDNRMFLIGPRPAVLQNMLAELGLLGLPWSDQQERRYQRLAAVCRSRPANWLWAHLPMRLRYNKFARARIRSRLTPIPTR